jgi:hypothetical protein
MDFRRMPASAEGGFAMNYLRLSLTPEEQQAICEDLLAIEQAGYLSRLAVVRRQMLREHRGASPWEQVEIDLLTKRASTLIGGSRGYWREAAAAALGIPSEAEVCIEAVCRVAEDARWQPEPEQREEPQQAAPRHRSTLSSKKRGGR